MATLTTDDLTDLRQRYARGRNPSWTKPQINAALQAIEDAVQSTSNVGNRTLKVYIGNAIEAAAPGVFNAQAKDDLFILWSIYNARRGGVI